MGRNGQRFPKKLTVYRLKALINPAINGNVKHSKISSTATYRSS